MIQLLKKEMKLAASPLSYIFIVFGLMAFVPGYPILVSSFFVCLVLLILGLFHLVFIGGFFKTAYKFAKPFVAFIVAAFVVVGIGETLFHIPELSALNAFGFEHIGLQIGVFTAGIVVFYC